MQLPRGKNSIMPFIGRNVHSHDIFSWLYKRPNLKERRTNKFDSTNYSPQLDTIIIRFGNRLLNHGQLNFTQSFKNKICDNVVSFSK